MRHNPYESVRYVTEYLLFHYGQAKDLCPFPCVPRQTLRFHTRLRTECLLPLKRAPRKTRGLDLGCGVGRFTFELGRVMDESIGIDNSKAFVQAAKRMAKEHELTVQANQSGHHFSALTLRLPAPLRHSNVEFQLGDAMDFCRCCDETFQIVAAINLICRLPRPRVFLGQLPRLVAAGGQLVLASPFSWMPEYSSPDEWLTAQNVIEVLRPHFRLVRRRDLPFVIREHRRKYQLVISEVMVFMRK